MARTMEIWILVETVMGSVLGDQQTVRLSVSQGVPILACYGGPPFSLPPARPQTPVSCLCFIQHHFHCDLSSTPHPPKLKPRTSKNTHTSICGKKRCCCAGGGWGGGQNVVDPTNQPTAAVKKKKDWNPTFIIIICTSRQLVLAAVQGNWVKRNEVEERMKNRRKWRGRKKDTNVDKNLARW
jgi:hypothetical protein